MLAKAKTRVCSRLANVVMGLVREKVCKNEWSCLSVAEEVVSALLLLSLADGVQFTGRGDDRAYSAMF